MNMFQDYDDCRLCPRQCGVNRRAGIRGRCGETDECRVASIGAHHGEEPSISGSEGSGTLFFSGCSCRCFFCQNYQISQDGLGQEYSAEALLQSARALAEQGVHNLNFVTPDHFWPHVEYVCRALRSEGVSIPFLFNSSGYQQPDMVPRYAECMDIFLPDFKFSDASLAELCMGDPAYADIALRALQKMVELKGFLRPFDETGDQTARQGVLVRHLVLPGYAGDSCTVLKTLAREFGPKLPLSIMSQYTPVPECKTRGLLTRRLRTEEYRQVTDCVEALGFEQVYIQDDLGDDAFLPDFSAHQPFEGNERGDGE